MADFFLSKHAFDAMSMSRIGDTILNKQTEIFLELTKEELDSILSSEMDRINEDPMYESPILLYKDQKFTEAKHIIEKVKSRNKTSLDYPKGIFVIDVDDEVAKTIQTECGVLCLSDKKFDLSVLTLKKNITCEEGEIKHSWADICDEMKKCPCNFVLINDRNLFTNDQRKYTNTIGISNVIKFLDGILPMSFVDNRFEVIIATEENNKPGFIQHDEIFNRLSDELKRIRNYTIRLIIISYLGRTPHYDATHNRRICTNYGVVKLDHKVAAFNISGKSTVDQNITYQSLYAEGLANGSDTIEEDQMLFLKRMCQIYLTIKSDNNNGVLSFGDTSNKDPRFLNLFPEICNSES